MSETHEAVYYNYEGDTLIAIREKSNVYDNITLEVYQSDKGINALLQFNYAEFCVFAESVMALKGD